MTCPACGERMRIQAFDSDVAGGSMIYSCPHCGKVKFTDGKPEVPKTVFRPAQPIRPNL